MTSKLSIIRNEKFLNDWRQGQKCAEHCQKEYLHSIQNFRENKACKCWMIAQKISFIQ